YWLWQTSGWNEWAETTVAATPAWLYWARCARKTQNPKPKKFFRPQAAKNDSGCCGFSRPIRASPQVKKSGSHARRDAGQGSWYRMYLTIRGRWRCFFSKDQLGRGPERIVRRSFSLHWGAGPVFAPAKPAFPPSMAVGGAPHQAANGGLSSDRRSHKPSRSDC